MPSRQGQFQKGQAAWNKGIPMSEEQRAVLSEARKAYYKRNPTGGWSKFCKNGHEKALYGDPHRCRKCWEIYYAANKDRLSRIAKERWAKGRAEGRLDSRRTAWRLKGILNPDGSPFTIQDYNLAFQIQGGMCKICGAHQSSQSRALCADHDHATGFFRGILCHHCNSALGHAKESKEVLLNIIKYIDGNEAHHE